MMLTYWDVFLRDRVDAIEKLNVARAEDEAYYKELAEGNSAFTPKALEARAEERAIRKAGKPIKKKSSALASFVPLNADTAWMSYESASLVDLGSRVPLDIRLKVVTDINRKVRRKYMSGLFDFAEETHQWHQTAARLLASHDVSSVTISAEELRLIFNKIDTDQSGLLDKNEIVVALRAAKKSEKEIRKTLQCLAEEELNFEQFKQLMVPSTSADKRGGGLRVMVGHQAGDAVMVRNKGRHNRRLANCSIAHPLAKSGLQSPRRRVLQRVYSVRELARMIADGIACCTPEMLVTPVPSHEPSKDVVDSAAEAHRTKQVTAPHSAKEKKQKKKK
jgi:hypothetical protein